MSSFSPSPSRFHSFVEAQQAQALHNLEIGVNNDGRPFLVGIAGSEGDHVVLVSVSLAAVED